MLSNMKIQFFICSFLILLTINTYGQSNLSEKTLRPSGIFSLGARSTIGFFNSHGANSVGAGGQFRIQLSNRINTEWYADYITSDLDNKVGRTDYHIGWSVFFYYLQKEDRLTPLFQPFIEAGHCFDYTEVRILQNAQSLSRWSSAVQMGTGTQINLTPRFDVTIKMQYMLHLGGDIHAHEHHGIYEIEEHKGFEREGHLLTTMSINYKLGNLWKSKK
jgi:hypothetical protein